MKIFYEVDIQRDFMYADGALYVPGAEAIKPNVKRLHDYAIENGIQIAGSMDCHLGDEEELARHGGPFPDHCIQGTDGQDLIAETDSNAHLHPHNLDGLVDDRFIKEAVDEKNPIYFEKQTYDAFSNPALSHFIAAHNVTEAMVYGVATDYCVKAAALGMLARSVQVNVVLDAVRGVGKISTENALAEMCGAGARFVMTKDLVV